MKHIAYIFNILAIITLASCKPTTKLTTTTGQMPGGSSILLKDSFLTNLFARHPQFFDTLIRQKDRWQMQVIYTQIDRNSNGKSRLTTHTFNLQPNTYFYPASTVKFPAAVLALQKLNELKLEGVDRNTSFITEAAGFEHTAVANDPSTADGRPTIAHYIKKILLVSDNDAFNRLYEFLGQNYLNTTLHDMGYDSTQIIHRLQISLNEAQNRATNPFAFYDTAARLLYRQPLRQSPLPYQPRNTFLGKGYISRGKLIEKPFDFSAKNRLTLTDLHGMLTAVIFPDAVPKKQRFNLTADDYRFLHRYMSMKPGESRFPQYDSSYTDAYVKFLLFGGDGKITNPSLRIFNKVGDAYGFLTDAAYVVDFEKGVEFLLSATIYCNSDGIFNDDRYDYNTVGFPFLKHLGQVIYEYEVQRSRKNRPDLSPFRFDYTNETE